MVPTCGSDGARQSRVQQPQQLGAPTVDATECGCWGSSSRSIRTDDPHFCLDRDIATGAGHVSATSEVVVVSADRSLALPPTRPRRALRNNVLKMLHLRRFWSTPACNIPKGARQTLAVLVRALGRPTLAHLLRPRSHDLLRRAMTLFVCGPRSAPLQTPLLAVLARDRREL